MRNSRGIAQLRWTHWALVFAAISGAYAFWLLAFEAEGIWRMGIGNAVVTLTALLAAGITLRLWSASAPSPLKRAWILVGGAMALWGLGGVIWAVYELVLRAEPPLPSLADPAHLAGYFLIVLAALLYPTQPRQSFGRIRFYLDLAITTGAIITLVWLTIIYPTVAYATAGPAASFWTAIYPIADLVVVLTITHVFLISERNDLRSGLGFAVVGLLAFMAADLVHAYQAVRGQFASGSLVDIGGIVGDGLLGLGALYDLQYRDRRKIPLGGATRQRLGVTIEALLPIAATTALVWYILLNLSSTGGIKPLAAWTSILLALALFLRQGILAGEAELRQYVHLVDNAADPAFICDANGRFHLVNPALLNAIRCGHEDQLKSVSALALISRDALPPELANELDGLLARALRSGWSGEVMLRRQDGTEFPAYLSLRPVRREPIAFSDKLAGTIHDLSEEKRQQSALRAAYQEVTAARRELEAANVRLEQKVEEKTRTLSEAYARLAAQNKALQTLDQLKSEFVTLVSHELRAPLTNVIGGLELALGRSDTPTRETLTLVQSEVRRLTRFVETILDLSALEAGRLPLRPGPVSIRQIVQTLRDQLAMTHTPDRLRLNVPADLPLLLADERALNSALFHLVDNAFKYAPQGDVTIDCRAENGRVVVSVSDQGPGIPPEFREAAFGMFQRLGPKDNQEVYGYGLGLYLTRRLIQAMEGDIQAEDAPGGARFTFWVPGFADDNV